MDERLSARIKREIELEFQRRAAPPDFPALSDVPAGRYTDPAFFELERHHLWSRSWLMVAHREELPAPGSFRLCDETGHPILLVRGQDKRIRAFYNTCRHRGGPVVREAAGQARQLRCAYHSWTYDLEGQLIAVPDEHDFVGLDRSCRALIPVRCETFGGWVFINEDDAAPPLLESLAPIPEEWSDLEPSKLRFVERQSFDLACNWKAAMDAFLEVYHLKHIHPNTVNQLLDPRGTTMGLLPGGHSRMVSAVRPERRDGYGGGGGGLEIETAGEIPRIANLSYTLFPNLVTPLDVIGFPFLLFWPRDIRTTRFDVVWFGPNWGDGEVPDPLRSILRLFDGVLREDTENLPWIQRSLESPGFRGMPLSYQERRIYHFHEAIDRAIGPEKIPRSLRVEPHLGPWIENQTQA
ncbi:aromatic ring-hydroxylating dioxygenase subunit alpha [Myxococcota bacterium]|nr:aromatic ring-hydroxylating dioxygenase subunit alpha [Myxococcota bacterium]